MCDIVLSHPRKVPNAEISCVWDGDLLYGHAVGALEDHLSEGGGGAFSKEALQEATFERVDQLGFPNAGCSTDQELHSVQWDLAQLQLTDVLLSKVILNETN